MTERDHDTGIDLTTPEEQEWMQGSSKPLRYSELTGETLFWNVDTQVDFMKPYGKLPVGEEQEGAEEIEPELEQLTELARENGYTIVNTADWHNQYSEELSENPDLLETFPEHCMMGSEGAEYVEATKPRNPLVFDWRDEYDIRAELEGYDGEIVVYKDRFNVFEGSPHTDEIVEELDPDTAVVYGVASDVCVDQAVNGLLERDIEVYVVEDAIKGINPENAENARKRWLERGAETVSTEEVEDYLEAV